MLMLLVAALAADPAAAATTTQVQEKAQVEKKICRKVENTSSRMAKRICKTETDWATHDRTTTANDLKRMGAR